MKVIIALVLFVASVYGQSTTPAATTPRESQEDRRIDLLAYELIDLQIRVNFLRQQVAQPGNEQVELIEVRDELRRVQALETQVVNEERRASESSQATQHELDELRQLSRATRNLLDILEDLLAQLETGTSRPTTARPSTTARPATTAPPATTARPATSARFEFFQQTATTQRETPEERRIDVLVDEVIELQLRVAFLQDQATTQSILVEEVEIRAELNRAERILRRVEEEERRNQVTAAEKQLLQQIAAAVQAAIRTLQQTLAQVQARNPSA